MPVLRAKLKVQEQAAQWHGHAILGHPHTSPRYPLPISGLTALRSPFTSSNLRKMHTAAAVGTARQLAPFPDGGHPPAAVIFDLDGTLTETELLKARSYAATVMLLLESQGVDELRLLDESVRPQACIRNLEEQQSSTGTMSCTTDDLVHDVAQRAANAAIDSYMQNIGGTTEDVARGIVEELHLHNALKHRMEQYGFQEPWQALYKWRKEIYASTFATDDNIFDARYMHNIEMLQRAANTGLPVAVATQSLTEDAERVTKILGVREYLKLVLGREQVAKPKPDPDIYLAAAAALGVEPSSCLVFEDSVTGLTAATRAGMHVVAVANPFSRPLLQQQTILAQDAIVYNPAHMDAIVQQQCLKLHELKSGGAVAAGGMK